MVNYDKMYGLLVEKGMQKKIAKLFIKKFQIEEESYKAPEDVKEWAMSRGFFPSRVELYGLNENNYHEYLSDYTDFMLHPYNNHFVIWINDKLSLKYTLGKDFNDIMPKYYLYVENNDDYTYLQDTPLTISKDNHFILNLLREKKVLIIKPNSSKSGGEGVMKVEWVDSSQINDKNYELGGVKINNKQLLTTEEFQTRIKDLRNNIVTEYVYQHSELKKIWADSECTLRIILVKLPHKDFYSKPRWKCIVSYARFGTSVSGGASNLSSGGIGIGFNFETGKLNPFGIRYREYCPDGQWKCFEHPDSHVVWDDVTLPNWDYVRENIYKVCNHYGSLSHLGFDVIISEKGFVFCEINSKPALNYEQVMCEPMLVSEENKRYFIEKGMDSVDNAAFYEIYKNSQELKNKDMKYYTMKETREFLESIGMPGGDLYDLPTSEKRFPDGGQYRFEVPGIQGPGPMKALLEALDEFGVKIHRVTQTKGIMFLTDDEIRKMVEYAKKWDVQLILACGPRATTDTSASVKTEEGQRMGYRLRGEEQIVRGLEEIKRGVRLGVRGFLIYDEGLLFALNEARKKGFIPADCHFKISAHSGHGNPCSAHVLETLGADSINPVRDIQVQMLASMRAAIDVPIDLHTENPKSSGGFIRHYEVPDFIRVAAPVYLKTGGSVAANHSYDTTEKEARQRAKQVMLVKRVIDEYYPEAIVSPK